MRGGNRLRRLLGALACGAVFVLLLGAAGASGGTAQSSLSDQERARLGERMYREGILPSGEPMQAYVKGNLPVPGTAFACASCHN